MKKVSNLFAALCSLFLVLTVFTSCATTTGDPNIDTISFGQAWSHVASSGSYWLWLGLSLLPISAYVYAALAGKVDTLNLPLTFALVVLVLFALLYAPAECAANTTIEQSLRGVFVA